MFCSRFLIVILLAVATGPLHAEPRLRLDSTLPLEYPEFVEPVAIAAGPLGQLFLADLGRNAIVRLDTLLHVAYEFEPPEDQLSLQPYDVAVSGFQVYVLDADSNALLRYTDSGAFLDVLRSFREERIETPRSVDVDIAGRVLLVNEAQHTARVLEESQQIETVVGGFGTRSGEFSSPTGGAFSSEGAFFISDTANGRVQHYTAVGNLEPTWFAGIEEPRGMCSGPRGGLWVADSKARALHWYAPSSFEHRQLDLPDIRPIDVTIVGDVVYVLSIDPPALVRVRVLRGE